MKILGLQFRTPTKDDRLEIAGAIPGMIGAMVLALNISISGWGWIAFLLSNIFWVGFSYKKQYPWMFVQQLVFTATSVTGIQRWLML